MRRVREISLATAGAVLVLFIGACDRGYELIVHNPCEETIRVTVFPDLQQARDAISGLQPDDLITIPPNGTGSFSMLEPYRRGETFGVVMETPGIQAVFEVISDSQAPRLDLPETAC
jgi:hypothetical protein